MTLAGDLIEYQLYCDLNSVGVGLELLWHFFFFYFLLSGLSMFNYAALLHVNMINFTWMLILRIGVYILLGYTVRELVSPFESSEYSYAWFGILI